MQNFSQGKIQQMQILRAMKLGLLSGLLALLVANAEAASFDCDQATTETEQTVCSSPDLSELDNQLGMIWTSKTRSVSEKDKQKMWIAERDLLGDAWWELRMAYEIRIAELVSDCEFLSSSQRINDGEYTREKMKEIINSRNDFEECQHADLAANPNNLTKAVYSIKMGCTPVRMQIFEYPIPERSGHWINAHCDGSMVYRYKALMGAVINKIVTVSPSLQNHIQSSQGKWLEYFELSCPKDFFDDIEQGYYPAAGRGNRCKIQVLRDRIFTLSRFMDMGDVLELGLPWPSIESLMAEPM